MLYFAYGSNMNTAQMKERCPNAKKLRKAILYGFRFIINSRGVATIIETQKDKDIVEGGLYEVGDDCLASLDYYEGVKKKYYYRKKVEIIYQNKKMEAITYIAEDQEEGNPRNGYIEKIIQGAEEFRLSKDYIKNNFKKYYASG